MMKLVVLSCLMAAASASVLAGVAAPLAYSTLVSPYNYRGPLSLAPGQPANILGADGRPLDTLEVNLDRSAHLTAKALNSGIHLLKKRSVAAVLAAPVARISPVIAHPAPLTYHVPVTTAHVAPITYAATFGHALI